MSKSKSDAHFPDGNEDIDNIETEDEQTDIPDLDVMDIQDLGKLYEAYDGKKEDIEAAMTEIKKTIFDKMETDKEEVGPYLCYKQVVLKFPELTIEKARELGITKVKEEIDTELRNKVYKNGVDLGKVEKNEAMVMRKKKIENEGKE